MAALHRLLFRKKIQGILYIALMLLLSPNLYSRDLSIVSGLSDSELNTDTWDLSGRSLASSFRGKISQSNKCYWEELEGRTDFFTIINDSIFWMGYNKGRDIGICAISPLYIYQMPGFTSDSPNAYSAKGHINAFPVKEEGQSYFEIIGKGNAIISPGDTVKNVVLTKNIFNHSVILNDSTATSLSRTVYRWHQSSGGIPFAIQTDGKLYIPDELNADLLNQENASDPNREYITDLIENALVEKSGNFISVTLKGEISINIYIMDMVGNIYRHVKSSSENTSIDISGLPQTTLIVSITSDDIPEYVRKIIL